MVCLCVYRVEPHLRPSRSPPRPLAVGTWKVYLIEPALLHRNTTVHATEAEACGKFCEVCSKERGVCRDCANLALVQWVRQKVLSVPNEG